MDKLKPIQDNFTIAGKIEDALSIQREIACIKAAPTLLIAPLLETASASTETSTLPDDPQMNPR